MIVSGLVFVLFMAMQVCTLIYSIELLICDSNILPSCLLKLCSIGVFMILGVELVNKPKESSRFVQSLFHIPVTGAELLMILNSIAGIVLCLWIFQVCFISVRHSLKKELFKFLSCIALSVVMTGIVIFLYCGNLSLPNKAAAEIVVCIAIIILIAILKLLLFFDREDDSEDDNKYDIYPSLLSILALFIIVYLTLSFG